MTNLQSSPGFSLEQKEKIARDWIIFIEKGFSYNQLSDELHHFLIQFLWRTQRMKSYRYLAMAPRGGDKVLFWLEYFENNLGSLSQFIEQVLSVLDHPDITDRIESYPATADIDLRIAQLLRERETTLNQAVHQALGSALEKQEDSPSKIRIMVAEAIAAAFSSPKTQITHPALFAIRINLTEQMTRVGTYQVKAPSNQATRTRSTGRRSGRSGEAKRSVHDNTI
jgi:hypothetical protein